MAKQKEKTKSPESRGTRGQTNWSRVNRLTDREIERAVASDPDAAPIATAAWFRQARLLDPRPKKAVSIRLEEDLIPACTANRSKAPQLLRMFRSTKLLVM